MSSANLKINVPGGFHAVHEIVIGVSNCLGATAINPTFKEIVAWTDEGDERRLNDWHEDTLINNAIQGITLWVSTGNDIFVSWRIEDNNWMLTFSEARGDYLCLEKIFGYLARNVFLPHKDYFSDRPVIIFAYD